MTYYIMFKAHLQQIPDPVSIIAADNSRFDEERLLSCILLGTVTDSKSQDRRLTRCSHTESSFQRI